MTNEERIELMRERPHTIKIDLEVTKDEFRAMLIESFRQQKSLDELARAALLAWIRPALRELLQGASSAAGSPYGVQ